MLNQQILVALRFPAALPLLLLAPPQWAWPLQRMVSPIIKIQYIISTVTSTKNTNKMADFDDNISSYSTGTCIHTYLAICCV